MTKRRQIATLGYLDSILLARTIDASSQEPDTTNGSTVTKVAVLEIRHGDMQNDKLVHSTLSAKIAGLAALSAAIDG